MRKYIDEQVECYCDRCEYWTDELYEWEGEELCRDCMYTAVDDCACRCDECKDAEVLFPYKGKHLCYSCFTDKFKIDLDEEFETDNSPDPMDIWKAWAEEHLDEED